MVTKRKMVKWTKQEWEIIFGQILKNLLKKNSDWLPLTTAGRYPLVSMLNEAQQALPSNRHRPTTVVQTPHRMMIIAGVNRLNEDAVLALRVKATPPAPIRIPLSVNHKTPLDSRRSTPPAPPVEAPKVAAPKAPVVEGFSFESLGRMLDSYLNKKINAAVDEVLPEVLRTAVAEAVNDAVKDLPKTVVTLKAGPMPGSTESKLLEDMVGILDEVEKLRAKVDMLQQQVGLPAEEKPTHKITLSSTSETPVKVADARPMYAVTGAYPNQMEDLKRTYIDTGKLRLRVFEATSPASDLSGCEAVYVFETQSTQQVVSKMREKLGRDKVITVRGSVSSVKRYLDKHVLTSQATVAAEAHKLFGLS
jgi:hypothetical protein